MPKIQLRARTDTYLSGAVVPAGEVVATIDTPHSAHEVANLFRVGHVHFMPADVEDAVGEDREPAGKPIEDLGLSQEVNDLLKAANVTTVAQARAFAEANNGFTVIQGIGPKTNKIIQTVLNANAQ